MSQPVLRLPNWEERLAKVFADTKGLGRYGSLDCALFAARGVQAVWGVDLASEYLGQYRTKRAGLRLANAETLEELVSKRMRAVAIPNAFRGAIGLWRAPKENLHSRAQEGLCIKDSAYWIAPFRRGLGLIEPHFIAKSWTLD